MKRFASIRIRRSIAPCFLQQQYRQQCRQMRRELYRQRGATLLVSLLLLVAALLLGISAANIALQAEKASRNDRDRHIAFQAAEAALRDAEADIDHSARSHIFSRHSAAGFPDEANQGCNSGVGNPYLGLCRHARSSVAPIWQTIDISGGESGTASSVPYGQFTGRSMQVGQGSLTSKLSRYIIELLIYKVPGESADVATYFYRITAIGFGARETTQVVLQTFYRKDS